MSKLGQCLMDVPLAADLTRKNKRSTLGWSTVGSLTKLGFMTCLPMVQDAIRLVELLYTETFLHMTRKKAGVKKRKSVPIKKAGRQ